MVDGAVPDGTISINHLPFFRHKCRGYSLSSLRDCQFQFVTVNSIRFVLQFLWALRQILMRDASIFLQIRVLLSICRFRLFGKTINILELLYVSPFKCHCNGKNQSPGGTTQNSTDIHIGTCLAPDKYRKINPTAPSLISGGCGWGLCTGNPHRRRSSGGRLSSSFP